MPTQQRLQTLATNIGILGGLSVTFSTLGYYNRDARLPYERVMKAKGIYR